MKLVNRLSSHRGETISEVLVASLVISLGMLLVATMISASFRILSREEKSYREYIEQKNIFETYSESKDASTMTISITPSEAGIGELKRDVEVFSRKIDDSTTFKRYSTVALK